MNLLKKTVRFLRSMKCAVLLLIILVLACTAGSLIPQGEILSYYTANYPETAAGLIMFLGLDDVFHCVWFVILTLFLCLNLLLCNVMHFPRLIGQMKSGFAPEKCVRGGGTVYLVRETEPVFAGMGFHRVQETVSDGKMLRYARRNSAGIWGAWLCHLGMLVIIAGFGLGQLLQTEYAVYGVAGQTKQIGGTEYELTIDDFQILLREDDTVEQYQADITVTETGTKKTASAVTRVNAPASLFGMKFYQNSTGWAAGVSVWKGEEKIQEELLCAGEYLKTEGKEELILMLRSFYPDYIQDEAGNPATATSSLKNPAYLYALYYNDDVLGMNVLHDGEKITVDDYTYVFHDPKPYTLIQVKKDPFQWLAALGGLLVVAALILAFYVRPEEMWAVRTESGVWAVSGRCRKAGAMFEEKLAERCIKAGGTLKPEEISGEKRADQCAEMEERKKDEQ